MKTYIQKKILSLMTENTGVNLLDSGGIYGRHWERNRKQKFLFNVDIKETEYGPIIPIHVYMNTMFETNKNTARFNRCLSDDYYWTGEAMDKLCDKFPDIYHDGHEYNTCNMENELSQDFQWAFFEYDGDDYCVFQLHGGCDVRGGYTSAQVFRITDMDYFFSFNCDYYDHETGNQWESFYNVEKDDECSIDKESGHVYYQGRRLYPYSSAMGF